MKYSLTLNWLDLELCRDSAQTRQKGREKENHMWRPSGLKQKLLTLPYKQKGGKYEIFYPFIYHCYSFIFF